MIKKRVSLDKKVTWFFIVSHIVGWLMAWMQTLWILYEIKEIKRGQQTKVYRPKRRN